MRDTIDFGIHLGTTKGAIAVVDDRVVRIIRNASQMDATPMAVWMPERDVVRVGVVARNQLDNDPENAHAEFLQEMGLHGARRTFAKAGVSLTPPQLLAEVLKSLRADAAASCGAAPKAAVIAVPNGFRLHQNNAITEAARLAGFTGKCPLIHQATAAFIGYGYDDDDGTTVLVFHLTGHTFDAAVVDVQNGDIRLLSHGGDPHLGGKLIDWAIVDKLLVPAAVDQLGLTDFVPGNRVWTSAFVKLKMAAEQAKVALSDHSEFRIDMLIQKGQGLNKHVVGLFEYTLTRAELDRVAEPFYVRAINLCREALTKAKLRTGDIDRLLLVGGATLAPALREMLADPCAGLDIRPDTSRDPRTVIVCGSAIYASVVPLQHSLTRSGARRPATDQPASPIATTTLGVALPNGRCVPLIVRGTTLPCLVTRSFQMGDPFDVDPDGVIRIPVVEGERDRADRNTQVAVIEIRLPDVKVPEGADVVLAVAVDASWRVAAYADVPMLAQRFDAVFNDVPCPDAETLRHRLSEAEARTGRLRTAIIQSGSRKPAEQLASIDRERIVEIVHDEVRLAARDRGAARAADQRIRDLMADLDEVEDALPATPRSDRLGPKAAALARFYALRQLRTAMTSPERAGELVEAGERALVGLRWDALRNLNHLLESLVPGGPRGRHR